MPVIFGTTTVTTNGTRVQVSNTARDVKKIAFKSRAANTGRIFVGLSDVSATVNGWELSIPLVGRPNDPLELDFGEASVKLSVFYVDSTVNGEICDWVAIVR